MDRRLNPYTPGAGKRPPELAGRERELEDVAVELDRAAAGLSARGAMLIGLRGTGKTVLLNEMRAQATSAGWGTGFLEAEPNNTRGQVGAALRQAALGLTGSRGLGERLRQFLTLLNVFSLTARADGGLELSMDVRTKSRDQADLATDLTKVVLEAGELAASAGTGIALFVDELQELDLGELAALCRACHVAGQHDLPLLVFGAGLPPLAPKLTAARSYAERLFTYLEIGPLARDEADRALAAPATEQGVAYTPGALDEIARLAVGYPFFIQTYGKAVWDAAARSPITAEDVHAARPIAERLLSIGFYETRYFRTTPAQQAYLRAMAGLGDGPVRTAAIARRLGRPITSVSAVRDELIRHGLVYSNARGQLAFSFPLFADWLRRQDTAGPRSPVDRVGRR